MTPPLITSQDLLARTEEIRKASPVEIRVTAAFVGILEGGWQKKTSYGFPALAVVEQDCHKNPFRCTTKGKGGEKEIVVPALAILPDFRRSVSSVYPIREDYGQVTIVIHQGRYFCLEHNRFI